MSDSLAIVITTVESAEDADQLATTLLDRSLAACIQIDGPIVSHYRWHGKLERANEFRLMIKTSRAMWPKLQQAVTDLHPYEEPEIILLPIEDSSEGYRHWVIEQTG